MPGCCCGRRPPLAVRAGRLRCCPRHASRRPHAPGRRAPAPGACVLQGAAACRRRGPLRRVGLVAGHTFQHCLERYFLITGPYRYFLCLARALVSYAQQQGCESQTKHAIAAAATPARLQSRREACLQGALPPRSDAVD